VPLVTILALAPHDPARVEATLDAAVEALAGVLERSVDDVWARFVAVERSVAGRGRERPEEQHPVVHVLARPQAPERVERALLAVARAVAGGLGVGERDVWARWVDLAPGMVLADGVVS
jgi:hypothetical protein